MKITYTLTNNDYFNLNFRLVDFGKLKKITLLLLITLSLINVIDSPQLRNPQMYMPAYFLIGTLFISTMLSILPSVVVYIVGLLFFFVIKIINIKLAKINKFLPFEISYEFTADEIKTATKYTKVVSKWESIVQVIRRKDCYVLVLFNGSSMYLPHKYFNKEQIQEFDELLKSKNK